MAKAVVNKAVLPRPAVLPATVRAKRQLSPNEFMSHTDRSVVCIVQLVTTAAVHLAIGPQQED